MLPSNRTAYPRASASPRLGWLALLAALAVAGCGGGGDGDGEAAFELVRVSDNSLGTVAKGQYLIRSQAEWERFWADHPYWYDDGRTVPVVDFSRNAVAGLFMGTSEPRCTKFDVREATRRGTTVTVRYAFKTDIIGGSACTVYGTLDYNFELMFLVPRDTVNVVFEEVPADPP